MFKPKIRVGRCGYDSMQGIVSALPTAENGQLDQMFQK